MQNSAKRFNYVIGDLQGCYRAFCQLLEHIKFDPSQDVIWFTGDLVARGEDSLSTLRAVKELVDNKHAYTVLGNHDLTLLAYARGFKKINKKDQIADILAAQDCDILLEWLRKQPLLLTLPNQSMMTHAGIPHIWSIDAAKAYAKEVEQLLSADWQVVDEFLAQMYDSRIDTWSDDLSGLTRLRVIVNYFTRMRLINIDGQLEFGFKAGLDAEMPEHFTPWFSLYPFTAPQQFFGHWASLQGQSKHPSLINVDGGCVWGADLIAYRLEDQHVFKVKNPI